MPFIGYETWGNQYFDGYLNEPGPDIPVKDIDAFPRNPMYRHCYNKLWVSEQQGIECGPFGTVPPKFPVFGKPIYNLHSLGIESGIIANVESYQQILKPGHMWVELHRGDHISADFAMVNGKVKWMLPIRGHSLGEGTFDYWELLRGIDPALEEKLTSFAEASLPGYTGMANLEAIGGNIIEMHLRFSEQWPDLYGEWFLPAVSALYRDGKWSDAGEQRQTAYSFALFAEPKRYAKPDQWFTKQLLTIPGISSIQYTFFENKPVNAQSMPPGGMRIAVVNAFDFAAGNFARRLIADDMGVANGPFVRHSAACHRLGTGGNGINLIAGAGIGAGSKLQRPEPALAAH